MEKILFYGSNDDCIEFEGAINEEYYLNTDGWTATLFNDGERLKLCADYGRDGWELSLSTIPGAECNWNVRFTQRPDRPEDPAIEIEVPEGTTIFVPDPTEG